MILLTVGADMLVRLMRTEPGDSAWVLTGPTDPAVVEPPAQPANDFDWPLAAE